MPEPLRLRRAEGAILVLFLLFSAAFSIVVPIGQAPDEPAHLQYVAHLLERGRLPEAPVSPTQLEYEAHQPPLDYVVSATLLNSCGFERLPLPFAVEIPFPSRPRGSLLTSPIPAGFVAEVAILRGLRIFWGLLAVAGSLALIRWMESSTAAPRPPGPSLAAAAVLLSPQLLFVSGTVGNDPLVIALATLSLLGLVRIASLPEAGIRLPLFAGALAAAALFAKATAIALVPAGLIVLVFLLRRRRFLEATALSAPAVAGVLGWLLLSRIRFGSPWPPPPTGWATDPIAGVVRFFADPSWIRTLWGTSWGFFGWMNCRLPYAAYVLFVPATLLAAIGGWSYLRRAKSELLPAILVSVPLTSFALLVSYMIRVDWQPQARYLFPSIAVFALFAVEGTRIAPLPASTRWRRESVARALALLTIVAAVASIGWIVTWYR